VQMDQLITIGLTSGNFGGYASIHGCIYFNGTCVITAVFHPDAVAYVPVVYAHFPINAMIPAPNNV
jgi:hypothetical protein